MALARAAVTGTHLATRSAARAAASMSSSAPAACPLGRLTPATSTLLVCDVQERFRGLIHCYPAVADATSRLVRGAGVLGVPVLVTEQAPKALGPTLSPEVLPFLPPGTLAPIAKTAFSMWPAIAPHLAARGGAAAAPHLVLVGIEAHVCVLQTALDATAAGFQVHLAVDAISSRRPGDRATGLARALGAGAHAATSEMVLFQWAGSAGHPHFKAVSALAKEGRPSPQLPGVGESGWDGGGGAVGAATPRL
jgi:nicotinamidase-related amidase